eukprot:s4831_g1.t1
MPGICSDGVLEDPLWQGTREPNRTCLALYKPEETVPFKARRLDTQSVAQDLAGLLEAQTANLWEGDDSASPLGRSSGLQALSDEGAASPARPRAPSGPRGDGTFRARQLREPPRLAGDLAQLSSATSAAPRSAAVAGRGVSKASELVTPPEPARRPNMRAARPKPRLAAQSAGRAGGDGGDTER